MRMVRCKRYGQELEGLIKPPFPGSLGQEIFDNWSQQAWNDWQKHQTMLINEKRLSLMKPEDRQFLQDEMRRFGKGEGLTTIEGYKPTTE